MSLQPEQSNQLDPFEAWRKLRDANMEAWSKTMIDLVNSEAYTQATNLWLNTFLTASQPFKEMTDKIMTQMLSELNMPIRSEVTSMAERMTNIEMRLDDLDSKLDDIQRSVESKLSDIQRALKDIAASRHETRTSRAHAKENH